MKEVITTADCRGNSYQYSPTLFVLFGQQGCIPYVQYSPLEHVTEKEITTSRFGRGS